MEHQDAIIRPVPGKDPLGIGPKCALVGHPMDAAAVCRLTGVDQSRARRLLLSRLVCAPNNDFSIIGPFIGAPYAAMLLETAVSWGAREIIFWGWCGAVSPDVHIGNLVVPDIAFIDEGTSRHYLVPQRRDIRPSDPFQAYLKTRLTKKAICFHKGPIWTTDAIFRETKKKIAFFRKKGALAVDMESSSLFSVAAFRNIPIGCILVVSDEVSSNQWIPGFNSPVFKAARQQAAELIADYLLGPSIF